MKRFHTLIAFALVIPITCEMTRIAHGRSVSGLHFGGPEILAGSCAEGPLVPAPMGQAFFGISLTRKHARGHPATQTRQTAWDFNEIIDRDYGLVCKTNDDGWLVGGGEPVESYKIPMMDSAHVTLMECGTLEERLGGISEDEIVEILSSGKVLIPCMQLVPLCVELNPDSPPEIEVRFHHVRGPPGTPVNEDWNWPLKFLQNQIFEHLEFPTRHGDDHYHLSVARKVEFRNAELHAEWVTKCAKAVARWQAMGPQPISEDVQDCGFWLYRNRNEPVRYFAPNFLPPYDTDEKRKIISTILNKNTGAKECGF